MISVSHGEIGFVHLFLLSSSILMSANLPLIEFLLVHDLESLVWRGTVANRDYFFAAFVALSLTNLIQGFKLYIELAMRCHW